MSCVVGYSLNDVAVSVRRLHKRDIRQHCVFRSLSRLLKFLKRALHAHVVHAWAVLRDFGQCELVFFFGVYAFPPFARQPLIPHDWELSARFAR